MRFAENTLSVTLLKIIARCGEGSRQQRAAVPRRPRAENEPLPLQCVCAWLNSGDKHMTMAASGAALVQWSADDEITVLALPEPTSTT